MRLAVAIGLVCAAGSIGAHAQVDPAAVDKLVREALDARGIPGLSVGVMSAGRVVLAKGYGMASLESREPVTERTRFAAGSLTKQLVCGVAFLLADEGRLSLDDPIGRFVTGLTRGDDVRLIDLARHTAGYRDYWPLDILVPEVVAGNGAEAARESARKPLDFAPRSRHGYSNTNYALLGEAIEAAGKAPYAALLEERIFKPLGMADSSVGPKGGRNATGHASVALGPWEPVATEGADWAGAAGSVWTTPTDMLRWSLALMEGKVLSPASRELMTANTRLADGRSVNYGCGLALGERRGRTIWTHYGMVSGFWAWHAMLPATRSAVVIFGNGQFLSGATLPVARAILNMLTPPDPSASAIAGPPLAEDALALMSGLQEGKVDRRRLGKTFNAWLTPERLASMSRSLRPLGNVPSPEVIFVEDRGGMEHSVVRFRFATATLDAEVYRGADGTIEQFFPYRD